MPSPPPAHAVRVLGGLGGAVASTCLRCFIGSLASDCFAVAAFSRARLAPVLLARSWCRRELPRQLGGFSVLCRCHLRLGANVDFLRKTGIFLSFISSRFLRERAQISQKFFLDFSEITHFFSFAWILDRVRLAGGPSSASTGAEPEGPAPGVVRGGATGDGR